MRGLPDPREKPWLTVDELAAITGEEPKAIRAAVAAGQLPSLRVGRYVRIPTARLLEQLGISPDSAKAEPASSAAASHHKDTRGPSDDSSIARPPLHVA